MVLPNLQGLLHEIWMLVEEGFTWGDVMTMAPWERRYFAGKVLERRQKDKAPKMPGM